MKYLAPILLAISVAMACFTDPQGLGVWVERGQVVSVQHSIDCAKGSNTKIVTETPQQVLKRLEDK
jgi:hypothetical protein